MDHPHADRRAFTVLMLDHLLARCSFPAGPLTCAVSGGPDSLALLALAAATGQSVTAIHVDHGLREGSHAEAELVATAADRFGAQFRSAIVTVDVGPNLEARARAARWSVLPEGTLTGHTADDQAETVMLNVLRGAGVDGMAGMRPEGHPILALRRTETWALCEALDLQPFHDPSNDDPRFLRNRIRHELLPLMDELAGRDTAAVLSRQAAHFRDAAQSLETQAAALDPRDARAVAAAAPALASRALRDWLSTAIDDERHPPDAAAIGRVLAVARGEAKGTDVAGGLRVERSQQRLSMVRSSGPSSGSGT